MSIQEYTTSGLRKWILTGRNIIQRLCKKSSPGSRKRRNPDLLMKGINVFLINQFDSDKMRIFSNGQFDIWKQWYVFDPKKGGYPGSFKKANKISSDLIVLRYISSHPETIKTNSVQSRDFLLTIFNYKKRVEEIEGVINSKGYNKDYYSKVNYMRKKAAELCAKNELKRLEDIEQFSDPVSV